MTDREKLIELLVNFVEVDAWDNGEFIEKDIDFQKIASDLIAHGVTVQKWISVEDRLPEDDTRVLVYLNIKKLDANTYTIFDTDRMLDGKWIRGNTYITHWMPLPQPPEEDKNERN